MYPLTALTSHSPGIPSEVILQHSGSSERVEEGNEWLFGSSQDKLAFSQATVGVGFLPACHALCSLIKIVKYTELLKYMVFVGPSVSTTHYPSFLSLILSLEAFCGFSQYIFSKNYSIGDFIESKTVFVVKHNTTWSNWKYVMVICSMTK